MTPTQPGQIDSFGSYIRSRRLSRGLSLTELARRLGVSKSYVSLLEGGSRVADQTLATRVASVLADPPGPYLDWVRAAKAGVSTLSALESTLEPLARVELRRDEAPRALNLDVRLAKPSAVAYHRSHYHAGGSHARLRVPLISEGTLPEAASAGGQHDVVRLDEDVLQGERLAKPFGWRLSEAGASSAPDILEAGDTVIISQDPGALADGEMYAVKDRDGVVRLSRVRVKGDVLLFMDAVGRVHDAVHAPGASPLSLIAGKVVLVIRPWRYAVLRLR